MSTCPQCGAVVFCGMVQASMRTKTDMPCWCQALPPVHADWLQRTDPARAGVQCLCPECLHAMTEPATDGGTTGKNTC